MKHYLHFFLLHFMWPLATEFLFCQDLFLEKWLWIYGNLVFPRMFWPDCATLGENVTWGREAGKKGSDICPQTPFKKQESATSPSANTVNRKRNDFMSTFPGSLGFPEIQELFLIVKLSDWITYFNCRIMHSNNHLQFSSLTCLKGFHCRHLKICTFIQDILRTLRCIFFS